MQLGRRSGGRQQRAVHRLRLPVNTVIDTTLVGLEPATFRSLVRRATSSATEPTKNISFNKKAVLSQHVFPTPNDSLIVIYFSLRTVKATGSAVPQSFATAKNRSSSPNLVRHIGWHLAEARKYLLTSVASTVSRRIYNVYIRG